MKNAINQQFKMTPGSKEVDTDGNFKMTPAVASMGAPSNYGMASSPAPKTDPDKDDYSKHNVGADGMTPSARKRKAEIEAAKKRQAERERKRAEAKKKRESGEYTPPKRDGDFSILGGLVTGNTKRYGGR